MQQLTVQKDQEREGLRSEMQARIDELLRLIEEEKQNMGAAGKKREEELLNKIAELEAVIAKREG